MAPESVVRVKSRQQSVRARSTTGPTAARQSNVVWESVQQARGG